jgi:branched-chain amino acid transport system ATP-binding protein
MSVLTCTDLSAGYDQLKILWDVSLNVEHGERVVILGANGAGKTTLLKTLVGLIGAWSGSITLNGEEVRHLSTDARMRRSVAYISDVGIIADLSVEDNLRVGGYHLRREAVQRKMDAMFERFPILRERRREAGGSLSGGQRKMLAVARGLMSDPTLLIMDEPSAGLSPLLVQEILELIQGLHGQDMAFLIAEQNVKFLDIADHVYVIDFGKVAFSGSVEELQHNDAVRRAYFGVEAIG